MLEVDEDSRLGNEVLLNGKRYGAPDVPSDELTAELYETAVSAWAGLGIERYEISNFARAGLRIAAQFEILAPGALRRIRRGRAFVRRRGARAKHRIARRVREAN